MNRMKPYMLRYWHYYFIGTITLLGSLILEMNAPVITEKIIDDVIIGKNTAIFTGLILMLFGITLGRAVFGYIKEMAFDLVGANIIKELRKDLFDHVQTLSQNFFEEKNTGELMSRLKDDADKVWQGISFGIMLVIEMIVLLIVVVVLMLRISVPLSLITFISLPIIAYLAYKLERDIDDIYGKISEQNAALNTTAQENIAGIRLVKAFAREKHEIQKFLKQNKGYYEHNMAFSRSIARRYPTIETISNMMPVFAVIIGGYFVIESDMTLGTLAKFLGYSYMVVWPMRLLGWLSSLMAEARAALKKINTVFDYKAEIYDDEKALELEDCVGYVTFDNVSLTLNDKEILKDINFTVKPGQTLAIMGATGSGKTSIINLMERFYEATKGTVRIDGHDVNSLTLQSLRSKIAVVMQEVFLFSDSIINNIHFGNDKDVVKENVTESASAASAHDFISRMKEDYETVIGERGIGLSGGQKQRISIARAFSKEAKILVMDDATSALDMETEYQIQSHIAQRKNATKIIIAHRISAVKDADEILILDNGTIVERGTHYELLKLKGRYFETFNEQYEGYTA